MLPVVARWLPHSARFAIAVARHFSDFTIAGMPALREVDVPDVMRVVAADLYRTLDATAAARRWTRRHPDAKVVAFPVACFGEMKGPDLLMQAAGICTLDLMHGYASEGNLQASWRTCSTLQSELDA